MVSSAIPKVVPPQGKGAHQNRDEQLFFSFQQADNIGDTGVQGARLGHYPKKSTYHKDKSGDINGLVEPLQGGHEDGRKRLALAFHLMVGASDGFSVLLVVILPGGNDPGQYGHD